MTQPVSSGSTVTLTWLDSRELEDALSSFQAGGDLRPDFDPQVMAIAIRAAIDAVPRRLAHDPDFDVDNYARQIAKLFDLATRPETNT